MTLEEAIGLAAGVGLLAWLVTVLLRTQGR